MFHLRMKHADGSIGWYRHEKLEEVQRLAKACEEAKIGWKRTGHIGVSITIQPKFPSQGAVLK